MAGFKTAYLQRAVPLDITVVGTVTEGTKVTSANRKAAIMRGDFVVLTPATSSVSAYIKKATAAQVTAKTATHIVALTDQTVSRGRVPTDYMDYAPSDLVGANVTTAPTDLMGAKKKVALYPIWDYNDIIPDADGNDVSA